MTHRTWAILAVALQLLVLAGIAAARQWTLATGTTVLLETAPVDPRDLFRGDYVTLNYRISVLDARALGSAETFRPGQIVYVGLESRGKYWEAVSIGSRPLGGTYLRGRAEYNLGGIMENIVRIAYGIESYFVPEGTGRQVETTRQPLSVEVTVGRDGTAVIRRLYIGDTPFP